MTQAEIGAKLGIPQMHVSRLQNRALNYLRDQLDGPRPARCVAGVRTALQLGRGHPQLPPGHIRLESRWLACRRYQRCQRPSVQVGGTRPEQIGSQAYGSPGRQLVVVLPAADRFDLPGFR
jgi:Sigma-70, region 4